MDHSEQQPTVTEDDDGRHRTGKKHKREDAQGTADQVMHQAESEDDEASPPPLSFADALQGN